MYPRNQKKKSTVAVLTAGLMAGLGGRILHVFIPCRANTGGPVLILHKALLSQAQADSLMNQALQPCSRQSEEPIGGWGDNRTHTTDYTHGHVLVHTKTHRLDRDMSLRVHQSKYTQR